ncbi:MAG: hypothetical protein GY927_21815, partial [bacterium]|nr:hypothetical protein [bacterium]
MFDFKHIRLSPSGDSISATCRIDQDEPFFEGHFPGQPIMPAVAQIQMIEALLRAHTGWNNDIRGGKSIKFLQRILPGDAVELQLTLDDEENIRFSL